MADQHGPRPSGENQGGNNDGGGGYFGSGQRGDRSGPPGGYGGGGRGPNPGYGGGGRPGGGRPGGGRPGGGRPGGGRPGGGRPSGGQGGFGGGGGGSGGGGGRSFGPRQDGGRFDGPQQRPMRLPKPDIVHKDDAILIVNKPAGVPVLHGNSPTLCEMVDGLTGARRRRMRVAHMIDDACSGGVLYVAMRDSEDSPRDQTHPETSYLALVEGVFDEAAARTGETISAPVSRSSGLGATPSTHIRVVDSGNGLSL
ncbi:unnamed protein product, partial [Laminaria digitata]